MQIAPDTQKGLGLHSLHCSSLEKAGKRGEVVFQIKYQVSFPIIRQLN